MTDETSTDPCTLGVTDEQIDLLAERLSEHRHSIARNTEDFYAFPNSLNNLRADIRFILVESARVTPAEARDRTVSRDVVKAIWSIVDRLYVDEDVRIVRDWLEPTT